MSFKSTKIIHNQIMPPAITLVLLIILVGFILVVRGFIHNNYEKASVPVLSGRHVIAANSQINESEHAVLAMVYSTFGLSDKLWREEDTSVTLYYKILLNYLKKSGVNLTPDEMSKIRDKIANLQEIINQEKTTNFMLMSLDGRNVVICILQQIYEVCGLTIIGNMEVSIDKICDQSGDAIYTNSTIDYISQAQVPAMCITMILILVSFGVLIIITKKNQLFRKEDVYHGFEEERFA